MELEGGVWKKKAFVVQVSDENSAMYSVLSNVSKKVSAGSMLEVGDADKNLPNFSRRGVNDEQGGYMSGGDCGSESEDEGKKWNIEEDMMA